MAETLGTPTTTLIHKDESHKLRHALEAAGTIRKGALVILNTDATISEAGLTDEPETVIGFAEMGGVIGDKITVAVRGYAIIEGVAAANAQDAGPVAQGAWSATPARFIFAAAVPGTDPVHGFALTGGDLGDIIKILVRD